jgi:hypothetical protein
MEEKDHLAASFVDVVDETIAVRPPIMMTCSQWGQDLADGVEAFADVSRVLVGVGGGLPLGIDLAAQHDDGKLDGGAMLLMRSLRLATRS